MQPSSSEKLPPATRSASTAWMARRLEALEKRHLLRQVQAVDHGAEPWLELSGKRLLNLSSNNYLGLAGHPDVREASARAASHEGASAGASRLISGTRPSCAELEESLARFKGVPSALLFNSGYIANVGVIPALVGKGDAILGDEFNHASIIDGCRLSGADYSIYPHRDVSTLEMRLRRLRASGHRGRILVVTDTVFSMDGDLAPVSDLAGTCDRFDAMFMVDEAHATGCLGPGGRGLIAAKGLEDRVTVSMSTLSKALGGFGAFVSGHGTVTSYLINACRTFIFTTALPPSVIAAALATLNVLERQPGLVEKLQANALYLRDGLRALGFDTLGSETHIVPVKIGEAAKTLEFAALLREQGVYAVAVRPPTVPAGGSRVRTSVMAVHPKKDLDFALHAFEHAGRAARLI